MTRAAHRLCGALLAGMLSGASAQAFEWDDGRGVLPYRFTTTRHYEAAKDLEHMQRFRAQGPDFAGSLSRQIRARAPRATRAGPGHATAQFHIGADGRVDSLNILSASSPAHAGIARAILRGVQTPPPPSGAYNGVQSFDFH